MATPVTMPQMGESVVEGTILRWLKSEGDSVEVDEPLVEVSTEKVDTEIPSPVSGTLVKILVQEGQTVEVGTPICEIDESGQAAAAPQEAQRKEEAPAAEAAQAPAEQEQGAPAGSEQPAPEPGEPARAEPERPAARVEAPAREEAPAGDGKVLSPVVRKLAREHDVDLTQVRGSGAGGRITREDVLAYIENKEAALASTRSAAPTTEVPPSAAPPHAPAAPPSAAPPPARPAAGEREEVQPLTHIRRRIAEHMVGSLQTSARAWNAIEVDMENIARLRARVNEDFRRREGSSLTYLPFIARACVDALAEVPVVNASMSEDGSQATYHHFVNLGIAVAVDYGLIVPVVKGAEAMNVVGLARAIRDLAERARSKKLQPDEVTGSTFTITNPGPFGSFVSVPIINQPNAAILSTEAVERRVVVVNDMIAIRHRTYLCMSWDHRLLDGSDAMRFLQRLKQNLETWDFSAEVAQL
jgi:2-oxoglutarate dehydrogenase E2 component (dihydrolipoamide succinyltransferase)